MSAKQLQHNFIFKMYWHYKKIFTWVLLKQLQNKFCDGQVCESLQSSCRITYVFKMYWHYMEIFKWVFLKQLQNTFCNGPECKSLQRITYV